MGEAELTRLAELVKTDPEFRSRFSADPKAAASSVGIDLSRSEFDEVTDALPDYSGIAFEWPPD